MTLSASLALAAAPGAPVVLDKSIIPVDVSAPQAGQFPPHGGYITRRTLRPEEASASMTFEVALKLNNFPDLQARVAHGQRISPREMAAKYEPSAAAYAQVTAWLTAQGFTITHQDNTHIAVFARGTVSQLQSALLLTFARVSNGSAEFTSAITAPSVPAELAPLLVGINGLQPHLRVHRHLLLQKSSLTGNGPPYLPGQLAQAYDATPLYTANITGSGQCIAIVIDTFPATSDLTTFWSDCNINQSLSNISFINVSGTSTLPATSGEETLDTEWSSAIAPGCKVRVYAAGALDSTAIDAAYGQVYTDATTTPSLAINQLSMSYGLGEQYEGASQAETDDEYFTLLTGAGVGLFAASGDAGATPGATGHKGNGPEQVEMPASDPNVTGVGGTSLTVTSSGNESSEVVWNNASGTFAGATGGGISEFFSRPGWQSGTGVPSGGARCVPDVAASADGNNGGFLIWNGSQYTAGGTSWSSPTWAGFCALINQTRARAGLNPAGQLAPLLYPYIGSSNFRDITSGNNEFQSRHGYSAGTGYDQCTGIGVPDVQVLASTLTPPTAPVFTDGPAPSAAGQIGSAYSFSYTATGQPAPTFALAANSQLPSGITLTSAGVLSGTATQSGVFTGTVTAGNGVNPDALQAYTIDVDQAPAITSPPLNATDATGTAYSFTFTASGYPAPTFSVTPANSLPPGLTLSSSGVLSGTPTQSGTYSGAIVASNGVGTAVMQNFTITISALPASDSPVLPPWGLVTLAITLMLAAGGLRSGATSYPQRSRRL